ncbi:MAG TPA: GspH/FimT family pseudopilin [Burkholderiales bacterium]|nr:GspH/FimT family pseudopilin [Burkholderiales bacterium]
MSLIRVQDGFTIVEVMISLTVLGVLIALGAPGFVEWLQNQQIRAAAEAALNGLQAARTEAVRSNLPVRFQFVTDLTSGCSRVNDQQNISWVVSYSDPTGKCDQAANPADPSNPQIVQSRAGGEGSSNAWATAVWVATPPAAGLAAADTVTFSPLGNVIANADTTPSIVKIDVTNPNIPPTSRRNLRIIVNAGGNLRMCDPAVVSATDPRGCPAWP